MLLRDRFDPRYFERDVLFRYHAGWAGLSFSRASGATLIDRTGTLQEVGQNVPRIDWSHGRPALLRLEPNRTNWIRNPRGERAVPGVIGSGGALPTHWGTINLGESSGLSIEVISTDIVDGIPATTLRVFGTIASSTLSLYINFESTTGVDAEAGQTWTGSVYVRRVAGALPQGGTVGLRISERQENGSLVQNAFTDQVISIDAPRLIDSWHSVSRTLTGAETAHVLLMLRITGPIGQDVDVTLQVGGAQLEQAPVPSSLILPPVGAPAASNRALDVLTAPWAHGLISFTGYARFVETGGAQLPGATVALWFMAGGGEVWLRSGAATPTYFITVRDSRGMAAQVQASPGVTTQVGQLVELMPQVEVSSQGVRARLIQAVDGGDPIASSWTGYVQTDWVPTALRLISRSGGSNQGQMDLLDLIVLRGAGWTMDQVRAYLPGW